MAAGHPKYGGTNEVTALDFGQPGGTLATALQALAYVKAQMGDLKTLSRLITLPEVPLQFEQVASFGGQACSLVGWILADTAGRLDTIEANINSYRDGILRNPDGTISQTTSILKRTRPTQFTHPLGEPKWERARVVSYRQTQERKTLPSGGAWAVAQAFELVVARMH